jgi:hypothetical protein
MSYHDGLVKLDAFLEEDLLWLKVVTLASILHLGEELGVVLLWKLNTWEQIGGDTPEKRDVVGSELRDVDIVQSFEADQILRPVRQESPLIAASSKNGLHCSHTKVIMELRRELLGGKPQ